MEHHRDFIVYSKHTRAEIISDTLFFKHKYLISPIVTPEDTVLEDSKRLTDTATANSKTTEYEEMQSLKQLAKVFKKIVENNAK